MMAVFSEAGSQSLEIVPGGINLYGNDGSRYAIPIPAPLSEVFYLSDGLLFKCEATLEFHHSQVLGTFAESAPSFTYLTLVKHPYSDLYPLLLGPSKLINTHLSILFASPKFPIILSYDSHTHNNVIYLIRVNKHALEDEMNSLESLDPALRDEIYGKHVASDGVLSLEPLLTMPGKNYSHIEVTGCSELHHLLIYLQSEDSIDVLCVDLTSDSSFPLNSIRMISTIEEVDSYCLVPRTNPIRHPKLKQSSSAMLKYLQSRVESCSSFLYVLFGGTLKIYDGVFLVQSIPLSCLLPSDPVCSPCTLENGSLRMNGRLISINASFEIKNCLVLRCLSALYSVLPTELSQTVQADIIQKLTDSKIRSLSDESEELGRDKSKEWGVFVFIVISLLKKGNPPLAKRVRISYSDERPGESAQPWDSLLNSEFHQSQTHHYRSIFQNSPMPRSKYSNEGSNLDLQTSPSSFAEHVLTVLESLHLLYEDMKLDFLERPYLCPLASLLFTIAKLLGKHGTNYAEHYCKDFPDLSTVYGEVEPALETFVTEYVSKTHNAVPSIYRWLEAVVNRQEAEFMPILFDNTRKVCRIFESLAIGSPCSGLSPLIKTKDTEMVDPETEQFPIFTPGLSSPSCDIIDFETHSSHERIVKILVQENISEHDLERLPPSFALPILEAIHKIKKDPPEGSAHWPKPALELIGRIDIYMNNTKQKQDTSTEQNYEHILNLELHRDDLNENFQVYIFPDDLRMEEAHYILDVTNALKLRMPDNIVSEDQFEAEKHNLLYKVCLRRASTCVGLGAMELGTSIASPTMTSQVPKINFSAYLHPNYETRMTMPASELEAKDKDFFVWPKFHIGVAAGLKMLSENPKDYVRNRQWITYHRREDQNEHAGFIMALGLLGQLEALHDLDIYRYLREEHEATIVAIYLGKAASALGSMDDKIMRILRISIAFLIPPYVDIDIKLAQEAASMLSFGLLYKGSGNRQVSEMLLVQLGRKALTNKDIEREGLSLSTGLALGMVNLATQGSTPGLEDLRIDERLVRLFEGGRRMAPPKILQTGFLISDSNKCSVSKEGEEVLTIITAPGALLAYALIHLKSNNPLVADKIQVPNSFFELDSVRPEHVCIKVLAKNLVMWDAIEPTEEWLYSQVPHLLRFCFENTLEEIYEKHPAEIDMGTIANCYLYALGGAMLSLGFRFMGQGDKEVAKVISQEILKLKDYKLQNIGRPMAPTNQNKRNVDRQALFSVTCAGCLALGMVMAGTGDIESFRVLKCIRKRVENDYGFNQAVHMAIGFLFLGNCQYSFENSDFAVAAMLCAVYPKFPSSVSDNRYHLQAYRHLYVLAVEKRLLVTRDALTKELVHVPLEIEYKDIGSIQMTSPVLLRSLKECRVIRVACEKFYEYSIHFSGNLVLFVKKTDRQKHRAVLPPPKATTQFLETWVHPAQGPAEFISLYTDVLPRISSSLELVPKLREFITDRFRIADCEVPGLLAFYTSLHSKNSTAFYFSREDLYNLILKKI